MIDDQDYYDNNTYCGNYSDYRCYCGNNNPESLIPNKHTHPTIQDLYNWWRETVGATLFLKENPQDKIIDFDINIPMPQVKPLKKELKRKKYMKTVIANIIHDLCTLKSYDQSVNRTIISQEDKDVVETIIKRNLQSAETTDDNQTFL